jgi:hypothetical protein
LHARLQRRWPRTVSSRESRLNLSKCCLPVCASLCGGPFWAPVCGCFRRALDQTGCQEAACRQRRLLAGCRWSQTALSWTRKAKSRGWASGSFGEVRPARLGRLLPTADVGCPVAQLGGLLSGDEIARPTGAGRPHAAIQRLGLTSAKLPLGGKRARALASLPSPSSRELGAIPPGKSHPAPGRIGASFVSWCERRLGGNA